RREVGLVGGVGEMFRFEAEPCAVLINRIALSRQCPIKEISCIALNAGFSSQHLQQSAAGRVRGCGGELRVWVVGVFVEHPTMVVSSPIFQLLVFYINIPSNGF